MSFQLGNCFDFDLVGIDGPCVNVVPEFFLCVPQSGISRVVDKCGRLISTGWKMPPDELPPSQRI